MFDLKPAIRAFILADDAIASQLAPYLDTRAVHTRRPLPKPVDGAPLSSVYPAIAISEPIGRGVETDLVDRTRRTLTHYINVYGLNASAAEYRAVTAIAFRLATIFNRPDATQFEGSYALVDAVAFGPTEAPTDDSALVGMMIAVQFTVVEKELVA